MSYCSNCIHYKVCGNEGVDDSAMTFCADKQTDKDLISRQDVEDAIAETIVNGESLGYAVAYDILYDIPSVKTNGNLVSKSVLDQIRWERDVAIEQLKDLGYGLGEKPRTDGDLISRQSAIDVISSVDNGENHIDELTTNVIGYIEQLPSADKTAEWIAQDIHNCHTDFRCSKCGYIYSFMHLYCKPTADYTYCPNCGCKMKEVE